MPDPALTVLAGDVTIHRLPPDAKIPAALFDSAFYSITRTADELSIICDTAMAVDHSKSNGPWSVIQAVGPLDFNLTGILAGLTATLAKNGIGLFAISTFDTDYLLVKKKDLFRARQALKKGGYTVR